VFEVTVPPFIVAVATTESDAEHPEGAVIVNVAVPEASVIAVPLWPASGPVIVKVTVVPTTGTPFDKATAVLVMVVEPEEPHTIEEFAGESTMVGPPDDPEHPLTMVSLPLIVTAPFLACARPFRVPPTSVMSVNAIIFPAKVLPVCMVAEEPTCQNTLQDDAPPMKATVAPVAVVRVLPILKIHTSVEMPLSVRVPVSSADDVKQ
jgi:hypothetical protein